MPLFSNISSLIPVIGTILSVRPPSGDCRNQMVSMTTDNGPVNVILSPDKKQKSRSSQSLAELRIKRLLISY